MLYIASAMGLSLHYNGTFNPSASLQEMIREVEDIATIYNWKYYIFETAFPENSMGLSGYNDSIYGICCAPAQCEPLYLTFLSNGRMASPENLRFWGKSMGTPEGGYLYMLATKTQYAGYPVHIVIVQLLRYLSKKYFLEFNVIDEGKYWETGDEHILKETFKRYTDMIDNFADLLETLPVNNNENIEEFIGRLFEYMKNKGASEDT